MRHNLMAHFFIALPAGAFGDQHLLMLIDDLGGKAFYEIKPRLTSILPSTVEHLAQPAPRANPDNVDPIGR